MNKNWLIRTKSNHILGPVSKEKVIELYKNGSIKGDDEVCSGNGYWFFIREKELIERYLLGSKTQPFNPISEAKDVITSDQNQENRQEPVVEEDVTLVGKSFSFKDLNKEPETPEASAPAVKEIPEEPIPGPVVVVHSHHEGVETPKKKIKLTAKAVVKKTNKKNKQLDHNFIKFFGIFAFILLLGVIYFRKTIMSYLSMVEFFPSAHAQTSPEVEKKKNFLEQVIEIDGVQFKPRINLEGLRIVSSFTVENLDCSKLNDEVTQLGIILYPMEEQNENFLKRVRDCVLPLADNNPVKRWLKKASEKKAGQVPPEQAEELAFIDSILNSGFNLITAPEQKNKITKIINKLDKDNLPERILQSYLYLLLGNIARSDDLMMKTYSSSPLDYWMKYPYEKNFWSEAISLRNEKIFERLSKHPADRTSFQLFSKYMNEFFNDEILSATTDQYFDDDNLKSKMKLKVYQIRATSFSSYLIYKMGSSRKRSRGVNTDVLNRAPKEFPWFWYFFEEFHDLPKNEKTHILNPYFQDTAIDSQLFFQLMASEDSIKEAFYQQKGQSAIKAKRQFYIKLFQDKNYRWVALFNLIEMGNINSEIVDKIMSYENEL